MAKNSSDGDVAIAERVRVIRPINYNVVFHNDNNTSMEFVVAALVNIFNHPPDRALALTLQIHNEGKGIAGTYSREVAEQKKLETEEWATECGFPLKLTLEPNG